MADRRTLRAVRKVYNDSTNPFDSMNPFDPINLPSGRVIPSMPDNQNQYFDPMAQLIANNSLGLGQQQITGLSGQSIFSN